MILKKTVSTYNKLRQLPNLAANELIGLLDYLSSEREAAAKKCVAPPNSLSPKLEGKSTNLQTIFSNKNKVQIVEMVALGSDTKGLWGQKEYHFVEILTDLLIFYRDQGEVFLSPSLYLQYLDLKKLQELVDCESKNEEQEALLQPLRTFVFNITKNSKIKAYKNEQPGFASTPLVRNLEYLESIKITENLANRFSIQKPRHIRVAHTDYSYMHISKDHLLDIRSNGLDLAYKHIKQSCFLGTVGCINAEHTIFEDCKLTSSKFHHSSFEWTKFINTNIDRAVFNDCRFYNVDFEGMINTDSAIFINCTFHLCKISGCQALFISCDYQQCEKSNLRIISRKKTVTALST